jgi:hypothetical protein
MIIISFVPTNCCTRYTEQTVDVHSSRNKTNKRVNIVRSISIVAVEST